MAFQVANRASIHSHFFVESILTVCLYFQVEKTILLSASLSKVFFSNSLEAKFLSSIIGINNVKRLYGQCRMASRWVGSERKGMIRLTRLKDPPKGLSQLRLNI